MKTFIPSHVFRLLLVATIGSGLGFLAWQLMSVTHVNNDTVWISNLVTPILPMLALAWLGSAIICGVLSVNPPTRSFGIRGLVTTLTIWLVTTSIVVGVYYSSGSAYSPPFIEVVSSAAQMAAALSFGFILGPMLIVRAIRTRGLRTICELA